MCEPITMGIMAGVAAAGTAVQIAASVQAADYEAEVAENNAKLAEWQANDAVVAGAETGSAARAAAAKTAAAAITVLAASGVETTTGSPADIPTASMVAAEMDAATAKVNAARQAWGYQEQARMGLGRAEMVRHASILGGVGAGLSGAASLALTGYQIFGGGGGGWSWSDWAKKGNASRTPQAVAIWGKF